MDIMRNMWVLNQNARTPESQSTMGLVVVIMGLVVVIVGLAVVIMGCWLYMKNNHAKANSDMKSGSEVKKISYSKADKDIIDLITELNDLIKKVKK